MFANVFFLGSTIMPALLKYAWSASMNSLTLKRSEFKASLKELKGPASAEQSLELKKPGDLKGCLKLLADRAGAGAAVV